MIQPGVSFERPNSSKIELQISVYKHTLMMILVSTAQEVSWR